MSVARRTYALALRDLFQPELLAAGAEATIKHGAEAAIKHGADIGSDILKDVAGKFAGDTIKNMVKKARDHFTDNSQKWEEVFKKAHEHAFKTLEIALAGPSFWESTWLGQLKTSATNQSLVDAMRGFFAEAFAAADDSFLQNCQRELRIARHQDFFKDLRGFKINELAHENNPLVQFDDPAALIDAELNLIDQIANDFRTNNYPNLARLLSFKPPEGQHMLAVAVQFHFKSAVLADEKLRNEFQYIKMERLGADLSSGFQFLAGLIVSQAQELESVLDGLSRVEIKVDQTHAVTVETHKAVVWLKSAVCELNANLRMANRPVTPLDQLNMPATETPKIDDHIRKLDQLPPPVRRQQSNLSLAISREAWVAGRFIESRRIARELATTSKSPLKKAEGYHLAYRCSLELQDFPAALDELMEAIRHDSSFEPFRMNRYVPEAIIGAGAFAVAFRCRDIFTENEDKTFPTVVVKSFESAELELSPAKIFNEAAILKEIAHANIIKVDNYDYADTKFLRRPFLVLEHFEGSCDFDRFLKQRSEPLTTTDLLRIVMPIAAGMKAAHAKGILHRDIKPANILIRQSGDLFEVKIIDFGLAMRQERLARSQHQQISAKKSMVGSSVAGSPDYAAPEQLDMERIKDVGPHSDVYAFGRLCYEALLGHPRPEPDDENTLDHAWKRLLRDATKGDIKWRLKNFDEVLARLNQIARPSSAALPATPVPVIQVVPSEQPPPRPKQEEPKTNKLVEGTKAGDRHVITFNEIEIPFRWCPPGKFKMGSPESEKDRYNNEKQADVTLTNGFWMGEFQVTQELYQAVTGQNPSRFKGSGKLPVEMVSWDDAQALIKKLNETKAVIDQLSGYRFALPTEAQWEYACRAGTTTATPFGNSLSSEQANFNGNYPYGNAKKKPWLQKTTEVGKYPPNPWGLYDMLGNVWEWCSNWYSDSLVGDTAAIEPLEDKATERVQRGGSFESIGINCRSANRYWNVPLFNTNYMGFRLAAVRS